MSTSRSERCYFKRLVLSNVRSFGDSQQLEMTNESGGPAQWTLILGENGVGKTTLLQCLASMCPVLAAAPDKPPDSTNTATPTRVEPALLRRADGELVALARSGEEIVELAALLVTGQRFASNKGRSIEISLEARVQVKNGELIDVTQTSVEMAKPIEPLVIAYSAARHMRYRGSEPFTLHPDTTASLFDPSVELADAKDILEQLDYATAKRQPGAKQFLARIKDALVKLLPDVDSASAITIYGPATPGTKGQKSGVRVTTPYGEVPLDALSLGYQTMTAWAIDLAWRLYQRYPNAAEPLHEPAIVLIDELDLHLHPRWQRELRESISSTFPQVQFIATAHSPLLAQSYLDMNIVVVREQDGQAVIESDPSVVRTWRIDEVVTSALYEVDSAFSPDIGRELQERTRLMQKSHLTPAKRRRLAKLNVLAKSLTPKFELESQRALDVIQKAAQLIEDDEL